MVSCEGVPVDWAVHLLDFERLQDPECQVTKLLIAEECDVEVREFLQPCRGFLVEVVADPRCLEDDSAGHGQQQPHPRPKQGWSEASWS